MAWSKGCNWFQLAHLLHLAVVVVQLQADLKSSVNLMMIAPPVLWLWSNNYEVYMLAPKFGYYKVKKFKKHIDKKQCYLKVGHHPLMSFFHPGSSSSHFVCILCNICFLALSLLLFNLDLCFDCNRFDWIGNGQFFGALYQRFLDPGLEVKLLMDFIQIYVFLDR